MTKREASGGHVTELRQCWHEPLKACSVPDPKRASHKKQIKNEARKKITFYDNFCGHPSFISSRPPCFLQVLNTCWQKRYSSLLFAETKWQNEGKEGCGAREMDFSQDTLQKQLILLQTLRGLMFGANHFLSEGRRQATYYLYSSDYH